MELRLSQPVTVSSFWYYPGLGTGDYNVEVSADEGHALVGYRHFADEQALNDFLQRQGKAF